MSEKIKFKISFGFRNRLITILHSLLLLSFAIEVNGQNALTFQNFSAEQGLSDNTVNCILQDSYGYMWVGTGNGLNRFDSYKMVNVPFNEDGEKNSRLNVYCLYEDQVNDLLIGTDKGLYKFFRETGSIELENGTDSLGNKIQLSNYAIRAIVKDQQENIWIGTFDGLNCITPGGELKIYRHDKTNANSINSNNITHLFSHDDKLLVGTNNGFAIYNQATDNFERFYHYKDKDVFSPEQKIVTCIENGPGSIIYIGSWGLGLFEFNLNTKKFISSHSYDPSMESGISGNTIFALKYDKDDNLWIGTENEGLNKYERRKGKFIVYTHEDYFYNSLAGNTIKCISSDNHGDLWIGTYQGGISKLDFNKIKLNHYQHLYNTKNSLSNNKITSFIEHSSSDIWIGTDGGGINRFNPQTAGFDHIRYERNNPFSLKTDIILSLEVLDNGKIWAGTYNEGINVLDESGRLISSYKMNLQDSLSLSGNNICAVFQDSRSGIWVGVYYDIPCIYRGNGEFLRIKYPLNSNHAIRDIRDFHEDEDGNIWMGSNGYLFRLDSIRGEKLYFKKFNIFGDSNKNYITTITSIEEDKEGNLWIGTKGRGLVKFLPRSGRSTVFTSKNGLPSDNIESLTVYQDGSLWVGTTDGLIQINTHYSENNDKLILRSYDSHDGLQGDVFNVNAALTTRDGMLLFGGNNGFNAFYPWKLKSNEHLPPVYITGLEINHQNIGKENDILAGRSIQSTNTIDLDYRENTVSLFFTAVELKNSEKVIYKYRLEGFEDHWNFAGVERKATYTNLAPGNYTFRVQATNSDGKWNSQGTSLNILISPPWWQTYWALGLYVVLVTMVVLLFRKYLLHTERKRNELRFEKIKVEKARELNDMKVQFFTNISHEIRTPLTLILGPVQELLSKWDYEPKQKLQLDLIMRNTKRLFQLVDQLMDFRKIENETLPYSPSNAELVSLMKVIFTDFQYLASNKNIDYSFSSSHEEFIYYFDTDKIQKIVNNIIANAFKFTRVNGKIAVRLIIDEERKTFTIKVLDDGIGIEEEHLDKVFDPFYQAHGEYFKKFKGTGVGLSLCKSLVRIMKGDIYVKSSTVGNVEQDFNTVFTVTCPILPGKLEEVQDVQKDSHKSLISSGLITDGSYDLKNGDNSEIDLPLVLLIEDNSDVRTFIESQLSDEYSFIFAHNGKEGLSKAQEHIPQIIISDVIMPEMDGVEMCKLLKSTPETSHIPVIMLSAKTSELNILEGLNTGADSYLTKPFNINILRLYLKNTLQTRQKLQERYRSDYNLSDLKVCSNKTDEDFLRTVIKKIRENISEFEFGVDELAREVGMSRTNFYKKIRSLTGMTVNDFVKNLKLKVAADLLVNSDYNVNEVAYHIGMKDASYFSRCFKETFGSLPSEFVKLNLKTIEGFNKEKDH